MNQTAGDVLTSPHRTSISSATATGAHGGRLLCPRPSTKREEIMKYQENAVLDALLRAQPFLDENAASLTGVDLTAARKRLDDVVVTFTAHAFHQDVGSRGAKGETAKQRQLRLELRRHPDGARRRHCTTESPNDSGVRLTESLLHAWQAVRDAGEPVLQRHRQ
jgi:hypothetical protein